METNTTTSTRIINATRSAIMDTTTSISIKETDTASTTIKGNSNNRQPNNTIVLHTVLALWTFWTCPDWMSDKS